MSSWLQRQVDPGSADRYRYRHDHPRAEQGALARTMSGFSSRAPDEDRVSATAALAALGGHALILLAVLLVGAPTQTVVVASGVVGVTLVSDAPGAAATSPTVSPAAASAAPGLPRRSPAADALAGESLDRLFTPEAATPSSTSAASPPPPRAARPPPGGASGSSGAPGSSGATSVAAGSSQADQGLGQGEGAEGVDLYAAASLPNVGQRPASPPAGDLWNRVAPCWRAAAPRKAILMVEIGSDGGLAAPPQAVRKISAPADPQTLLAERAAVRALQACAPYAGLGARRWRVAFP